MKKLFLIPLMAMLCTVMAWATNPHVTDIAGLKAAIADASIETIYLDADINYASTASSSCINILRSVTIDGQGHTLSGYGRRASGSNYPTIAINHGNTSEISVILKDINIVSTYRTTHNNRYARPVECRDHVESLTLSNVSISVDDETKVYAQGLTIGGDDRGWDKTTTLVIENSQINVGKSGYPVVSFNPYTLTATNSIFTGYCGLYFKAADGSKGSAGTVVNATNCDFDAPNAHAYADGWNNFGVFTMEDGNITLNLHNCGMNAQEIGLANQGMLLPEAVGCEVNISGDNSHINGHMVLEDSKYPGYWLCTLALTGSLSITGGTYSTNPAHVGPFNPYRWYGSQNPSLPNEDVYASFVPSTHEVQEIKQGDVTLYRVVKKAEEKAPGVMYDLNDLVAGEGEDYGDNPVSSFDLSTGDTMTLNQGTTTAGYVQVSDNITYNTETSTYDTTATTIQVGKVENEGTPSETKVNQTLVINNGLDVQGDSQVEVQAGSTLEIGEGGINTEKPENIVIEADSTGAASLLLDPTITINRTPELTVKMTTKTGRDEYGNFMWHRFAMPVDGISSWEKKGKLVAADGYNEGVLNYPTYLYGWDYDNNDWDNIGVSEMKPLQGYTLTLASDYIHVDGTGKVTNDTTDGGNLNKPQNVTYIFKGNLVGNTDQPLTFKAEGFNFFGNSYTGYIDVRTLIGGFASNNVEGTVYMWCNDSEDDEGRYQSYVGVPLYYLQSDALRSTLEDWQKEVAPMQTFILRLRGADSADESVDYASAIWGNPRYGHSTSSPAPRRVVAANNIESHMAIVVKANGKGSRVEFTQDANYTDAFESGCDVVKYMNENTINLYATVNGEDLSSVVTNSLNGKLLSLQTNGEVNYTMSFKNVAGTQYAILDHATNQMTVIAEGSTYQFAAQPNSTVEGRFEIVSINHMPTAIENTEVKASAKGIYTIMGQYVGEDFETLPAGVYVVDGVKIVK